MSSATDGVLLPGGTANFGRVIRVGDTVHRPRGAYTPAVHALLRHLEGTGFTGAPRVLSADPATSSETEVLGFIEGAAASEPLPEWASGDDVLVSVGLLLGDYHRRAASFDGSVGLWQRPVPARWRGDLVTHNDVNPANVIFRDQRAVALIDFDLAAPGTPAWELAVTACFWVPLRDDADLAEAHRSRRRERYDLLLDAYGASSALRREVFDALVSANQWIAGIIKDAARSGHPAFGRVWERKRQIHTRAGAWLATHASELRGATPS
jgi:hypothetical protein